MPKRTFSNSRWYVSPRRHLFLHEMGSSGGGDYVDKGPIHSMKGLEMEEEGVVIKLVVFVVGPKEKKYILKWGNCDFWQTAAHRKLSQFSQPANYLRLFGNF